MHRATGVSPSVCVTLASEAVKAIHRFGRLLLGLRVGERGLCFLTVPSSAQVFGGSVDSG